MVNHWWQVTLYVTPRGLTTSSMPDGDRMFEIEFDFCAHQLRITVEGGEQRALALEPKTVADVLRARSWPRWRRSASTCTIWPVPVEIEHAIPFAEDTEHACYDADAAQLFWRQLVQADRVLRAFRARLRRQGQPGALLLGRDGPGRDALLRPDRAAPSGRRAQLRRLGHGRGLLARAGQLRLLAGRRRGGRVLRLRLSRARRLRRHAGHARRRPSTPPTSASSCCPTRRSAPPPTPTRRCSGSCRPPTRPRPTSAAGTAPRSSTRRSRAPARADPQGGYGEFWRGLGEGLVEWGGARL